MAGMLSNRKECACCEQAEETSISATVLEEHQKVSAAIESTTARLKEAEALVTRCVAMEVAHFWDAGGD